MSLVIGITGSIATGKSTISNMVKELGYTVVDADICARQVVEQGEEAYDKIKKHFGEDILLPNGDIDRKKLGDIVFHHDDKRLLLNSIVHPAVRHKMLEEKNAAFNRGEQVVFLDIPLLYESNLTYMVDKVLVVYVDSTTQLERLMNRNHLSKEEAEARIRSQIPIEQKKEKADAFIDNRGTIEQSKEQLLTILKDWQVRKK